MNSKTKIILIATTVFFSIICLILAFGDSSTSQANNGDNFERKIEDLAIDKNQERTKVTAKYQIEPDKPVLIIYSAQIRNFDLKKLKDELGEKNVGVDLEQELIHLYMKDQTSVDGRGTLTLETINQNQTYFEIRDIDHQIMKSEFLNQPNATHAENERKPVNNGLETGEVLKDPDGVNSETNQITNNDQPNTDSDKSFDSNHANAPGDEINDNEENPTSGWTASDKLQISPVLIGKNADGHNVYQVIYFGALNYALQNTGVIDSVGGRPVHSLAIAAGNGRKNNITAANHAVITVPPGGSVYDHQYEKVDPNGNTWITNTFGDGHVNVGKNSVTENFGSQRNFVTTNLYDYYKHSKSFKFPYLLGPDNEDSDGPDTISLVEEKPFPPKFYFKNNANGTSYPAQRIVFHQKFGKYHLKISITQGFNPDGSLYVRTVFKNVGAMNIPHFTGYTFRDITFMKNHNFGTMEKNNILRSLGGNRGIYATRKAYNGSMEMHMDTFDDAPFAWAAQGTKSSYFATTDDIPWLSKKIKGFPWKVNVSDNYERPFFDIDDKANAAPENEKGLGKKAIANDDNKNWDSGVSMHTMDQPLGIGEKISMAYAIDVVPISNHPMIELHQKGSFEDPLVLQPNQKELKIDGGWFHFGHPEVNLNYLMKPLNPLEPNKKYTAQEILAENLSMGTKKQTAAQQKVGTRFPWDKTISTEGLSPGKYVIAVVAVDTSKEKMQSAVKQLVFEIPRVATKEPQLEITAPAPHSPNDMYVPTSDILNIKGIWSDKDSESISLIYAYDDEKPKKLLDHEKNIPGKVMPWVLDDFNIKDVNDTKPHKITFTIDDHDPSTNNSTKIFYFSRKDGSYQLIAPEKINFGIHHVVKGQTKTVKPELFGDFKVRDFRKDNSSPIRISLKTANFKTNNNKELDTSVIFDQTNFPSGQKMPFKEVKNIPGEWLTVTDYTDELKKELKLKFKQTNDTSNGTFKSHWIWEACDSVC